MSAPPAAPASTSTASNPPLRRPRDDRLIVGVCAGIARTLGVPALVVRIVGLVVAVALPPIGLIAYAALAIAMPRDDGRLLLGGDPPDRRETIVGWALVVAALISVGIGFGSTFIGGPGGLVLLAGGVILLLVQHQRRGDRPAVEAVPAPLTPPAPAASVAAARPAGGRAHELPYPGPVRPTALAAAPVTAVTEPLPFAHGGDEPPAAPPPSRREPSIAVIGFALLVLAAAVGIILHAVGAIDLSASAVAVALGVGAAALTVAAIVFARRRGAIALVVLAVLLALGSLGAATVGDHVEEGIGERTEIPITAEDLQQEFRLGIGALHIDLTEAELPEGVTTVTGRLGIGELEVRVPPGVRVTSVGETRVDGTGSVNRAAGAAADRTVRIDASVDHGSADVVVVGSPAP